MACLAQLLDTGTNKYIHFTNVSHDGGDSNIAVPANTTIAIEEGTMDMTPPTKSEIWSGMSPFRHGEDLINVTYENRRITFNFSIMNATAASISDTVVAINKMLESARQYALWPVRRGVEFRYKLLDGDETVAFDVIDGELRLPFSILDYANFQLYGGQYVLSGCSLTLICKPLARGTYTQLVTSTTCYTVDEGINYILVYDASASDYEHLDQSPPYLNNYAAKDYFFLFPENGEAVGADLPANGDYIAFGCKSKFEALYFTIGQAAAYSAATFTWQYWNGSAWTNFTPDTDTTNGFQDTGRVEVTWTASNLSGWATTDEGGLGDACYYVRCLLSGISGWTTNVRQDGDIVHRKDNKVYVDASSISGDVPSPLTVIVKSNQTKDEHGATEVDLFPTSQIKVFAVNRYALTRIRGLYEAELGHPQSGWSGYTVESNAAGASADKYVYWTTTGTSEQRLIYWDLSESSGMQRDRWGRYIVAIRYRDWNTGSGNMMVKARCYIARDDATGNILGEEGRWYTLPVSYGAINSGDSSTQPRWNTVDIARFPMPPANINYQTGYFVSLDLWFKRKSGSARFDLDLLYLRPADQYVFTARTSTDHWHNDSANDDDGLSYPYAILDTEFRSAIISDDNTPAEDPASSGAAVALAGFDAYESGTYPWVHPNQNLLLGVHIKQGAQSEGMRYDHVDDNVSVEIWYAPRYLHVGN